MLLDAGWNKLKFKVYRDFDRKVYRIFFQFFVTFADFHKMLVGHSSFKLKKHKTVKIKYTKK